MERMSEILSGLYTQLILRDFVGKVLPGAVVFAGLLLTHKPTATVLDGTRGLPAALWLLLAAAAWIMGFTVQSLGELTGLVRYFPTSVPLDAFYELQIEVENRGSASDILNVERLRVIKEACGNTQMALLVVSLYWLLHRVRLWAQHHEEPTLQHVTVLLACVLLILLLGRMHRIHVGRQYSYMKHLQASYSAQPAPPSESKQSAPP